MRKILLSVALMMASIALHATDANYQVVPLPQSITMQKGDAFVLDGTTSVLSLSPDEAMQRNVQFLKQYIRETTGIAPEGTSKKGSVILLELNNKIENDEGYVITVKTKTITIEGKTAAGVFYGIQTLRKAIPQTGAQKLFFPSVTINDQPRFGYRGAMLDVARHFFSFEEVKTFIDILALHNINRFHWHLTDDQGWRIEIKKYPRLTEVSSMRPETMVGHDASKFDGKPHGGFYTQEQARAIVKYAADRDIMVVPEIDMPGHMVAALAAYPELGCTGGPYSLNPCCNGRCTRTAKLGLCFV